MSTASVFQRQGSPVEEENDEHRCENLRSSAPAQEFRERIRETDDCGAQEGGPLSGIQSNELVPWECQERR